MIRNEKDVRQYFDRKVSAAAVLSNILAALLLLYVIVFRDEDGFVEAGLGLLFLIPGIGIPVYKMNKYSDKNMDAYCRDLANRLAHQISAEGVGSENAQRVHFAYAYCFENVFDVRRARIGKDGIKRTSILEVVCLNADKNAVHCTADKVSLVDQSRLRQTKLIHPADIASMDGEEVNGNSYLNIRFLQGDAVRIVCSDNQQRRFLTDRLNAGKAAALSGIR